MNIIFPDPALVWMLRRVVGVGLLYHLFRNNHTPALSDTIADYQEASWSGYAPILIPAANWILGNVDGHVGVLQAGAVNFPNTSPAPMSVYGYYVTDDTDTDFVCAARFDIVPFVIVTGDFCPVTPLLGSYSGNSV